MCIDVNIVGIDTPQNFLTHFTIIILGFHMLALHMFVQIGFLFGEVSTISTQPSSINFFHLLMNLSVNVYWQIKTIRLGLYSVYFLLIYCTIACRNFYEQYTDGRCRNLYPCTLCHTIDRYNIVPQHVYFQCVWIDCLCGWFDNYSPYTSNSFQTSTSLN